MRYTTLAVSAALTLALVATLLMPPAASANTHDNFAPAPGGGSVRMRIGF